WAARNGLVRRQTDVAGVALGLAEPAGHVGDATLGLDHAGATAVDEQRIVDGATVSRPFGNGDGLAGLQARPRCMSQRRCVDRPASGSELLVDQEARGRLVELDLLRLPVGELRQQIELLWWCG